MSTYDVALEVIALGKRAKGKYLFVTEVESGHHPYESTNGRAEMDFTLDRQVAGLQVDNTLDALRGSIVSKVDVDSQDGVDHHLARICIDMLRKLLSRNAMMIG